MRQVDLALLAEAYDFRPMGEAARHRAREAMSAGPRPVHIALDIGGGRGEHASVWAAAGVHAVLVDPSPAMLSKASPELHTILATAQSLPIADHAVDMVYFHLSIHYGDWKKALVEACRVLRFGGVGRVYTLGNRHHKQSFLNRWFPSVGEIDELRFPDPARVAAFLAALGHSVTVTQEDEKITTTPERFRVSVAAGYVSTLQLISAEEHESGMRKFEKVYGHVDTLEYILALDRISWTKRAAVAAGYDTQHET